jgi:hypothetical protein
MRVGGESLSTRREMLSVPLSASVSVVNTNTPRSLRSSSLAETAFCAAEGRWYSPRRHRGTEGNGVTFFLFFPAPECDEAMKAVARFFDRHLGA